MMGLRNARVPSHLTTPIGFKIWFAFVACLIACVWITCGYVVYSVISAGPEGVGHAIGGFVKAVRESAQ